MERVTAFLRMDMPALEKPSLGLLGIIGLLVHLINQQLVDNNLEYWVGLGGLQIAWFGR